MRVGIFIDTNDLYHSTRKVFPGKKLNYTVVREQLGKVGDIVKNIVYGMHIERKSGSFISCLRQVGFEVKFKKPSRLLVGENEVRICDWNIPIVLDIISVLSNLDCIVLGTTRYQLYPLIQWLQQQGKKVIMLTPKESFLTQAADDVILIHEEWLEKEE